MSVEYRILEIYSHDRGQRSAKIGFNVGQGTQDIGFRNEIDLLFNILPAHLVRLHVWTRRANQQPLPSLSATVSTGSIPIPSKRLAPDLFFQPQIYRADGDKVVLPAGKYTVTCSMGPEYIAQTKDVTVPESGAGGDLLRPAALDRSFARRRGIRAIITCTRQAAPTIRIRRKAFRPKP